MQAEYTKAGAKEAMKTGTDIENAVHASMAAQGVGLTTAGSTSSSGTVTITATTMTKSQPILTRGTEIHEAEHAAHTLALQKKYGGKTAAFQEVDPAMRDRLRRWLVTARVEEVLQGELPADHGTLSLLVHSPSRVFMDADIVDREYVITLEEPLTDPYTGDITVALDDA